jgi:hypothetical protein
MIMLDNKPSGYDLIKNGKDEANFIPHLIYLKTIYSLYTNKPTFLMLLYI